MIKFKKFVEFFDHNNRVTAAFQDEYQRSLINKFLTLVPKVRTFVIAEEIAREKWDESKIAENETFLDLPFPVCSLEFAGTTATEAFVFNENAPGDYEIWSRVPEERGVVVTNNKSPGYAKSVALWASIFRALYVGHIATEKVNERVKIRVNGEKKTIKIREVIHVTKNKMLSARGPYGGPIEHTHRWEVAGHWRAISGIGKDRAGSYGIKGFTWVVPHVKGPDEKLLVKKQRVIHESTTNAVNC